MHHRSTKADLPLLYPPYTKAKEKAVRWGMAAGDPRDAFARVVNRLRRR